MKNLKKLITVVMFTVCFSLVGFSFGGVHSVYAVADDFSAQTTESSGNSDNGLADYIEGFQSMTPDNLAQANYVVSPFVNLIGNIMGGILILGLTLIGLITSLDLLYIGFPPIRNFLFKDGQQSPMGGGYGGMQQQNTTSERRQWVSDEAVQCVALGGNNQQQGAISGGGMPGMQMNQNIQNIPVKSVMATYLKRRVVFLVLFALGSVILTSSLIMGFGVNLAQWLLDMLTTLKNYIPV